MRGTCPPFEFNCYGVEVLVRGDDSSIFSEDIRKNLQATIGEHIKDSIK